MESNYFEQESIINMDINEIIDQLKNIGERPLHKLLVDEAIKETDKISPAENKTRVLTEISINLFNYGLEKLGMDVYKKSVKESEIIIKKSDRSKTLSDMAGYFFDIDKKLSEELFYKSLDVAGEISDKIEKVNTFAFIAENKVRVGLTEGARRDCEKVYETSLNLAEKKHKVLPLLNIAQVFAESNSIQKSTNICEYVSRILDDISDENERCWAMGKMAIIYTYSQKIEKAVEISYKLCSQEENLPVGNVMISFTEANKMDKAIDLSKCISNSKLTDSILGEMVSTLSDRNQIQEAKYVNDLIEDRNEKDWSEKDIASALAHIGEHERAIDIAENIIDIDAKILAFTDIIKHLLESKHDMVITELLEEVLKLSENSESDSVEVNIVEVLADTGSLDLAIDRSRNIETSEEKAIALSYVSARSGGITSLSQDFLNTLESITDEKGEIDGKIKDELKSIALKLSENVSRKDIYESIDSIHDMIDGEDR